MVMPFFWEKNIGYITGRKVSDKNKYDEDLRKAFEDS
jgi:hypothetical protein